MEGSGIAKSSVAVLGIDLGKNSCSLVGFDPAGTVVLRRRARRDTIVGLTAKLPACVVAMEACCGAHHLGRLLAAQGHTIRLMSPEYAKAKKNDDRDAEAIAEAATRPTMRFVPLKAPDQLDMQSLHRVRSRLVSMRTMLMNQLRAILLERGLVFPQGRRKFETAVGILVTDPQAQIGARIQALVAEIREEWASLDGRIEALDREFVAHARADEAARRLVSISGVGPMTATALRAAVDDGSAFASARDLPAWLGLVPRQHTTGGKPKLLGISKRGNAYLRGLFIHGARAALASLSKVEDATGRWLRSLLECTPVGPKIAV
ncbi:IS110 family transposase [Methylorubrum extorquens]|jgi:transposase|uniref:Transposase IS116/IS110/IS902 family protein n=1 Tax=Methylorubrum extorquens (strain CM4 / NCIMB 13688) TaxID=440085 RepID=B7KNP1_METC4|nr:transposase IS116/IS110/IS902 family protein [Methylorubrum extorquens CM4]GEL44518.1 IS110 family transposase [Methylorubrum extorquens]